MIEHSIQRPRRRMGEGFYRSKGGRFLGMRRMSRRKLPLILSRQSRCCKLSDWNKRTFRGSFILGSHKGFLGERGHLESYERRRGSEYLFKALDIATDMQLPFLLFQLF